MKVRVEVSADEEVFLVPVIKMLLEEKLSAFEWEVVAATPKRAAREPQIGAVAWVRLRDSTVHLCRWVRRPEGERAWRVLGAGKRYIDPCDIRGTEPYMGVVGELLNGD